MKKYLAGKALAVSAIVSAAVALSSCGGDFKTQQTTISEKFALAEGRTDSLDFSIDAEFPVSGLGKVAYLKISSAITDALFGEDYMAMTPEAACKAYMEDRVSGYRAENLPMAENVEFAGSSFDRADYTSGEFTSDGGDILSYLVTKYVYSGGAHGMSSVTAYNFNRRTGDTITEESFFSDGYVEPLTRLLTKHLPEALESPADTSMLFLNEIEPNGNFSIGDAGITYIYNQYEIAPYSMGIIKVTVPWEELEGLH